MKEENYIIEDYNLNIISINQLITNSIERIITMYCSKINFNINYKTRDTKRLFFHFIADNILQTLTKYTELRNILFFSDVKSLTMLPNDCVDLVNSTVRKIVSKFKLCTFFADTELTEFSIDDIYAIKTISDNCSIKSSNLSQIKKFLQKSEYKHLLDKVSLDLKVRHIIMST